MDDYQAKLQNHPLLLENDTENYVLYSELEDDLKKALEKLPADISKIFLLNRFEGLTYPEIASQLNLSVRMVEIRMGKALALLKQYLKDYLITIAIIDFDNVRKKLALLQNLTQATEGTEAEFNRLSQKIEALCFIEITEPNESKPLRI